MEFQNGKIYTIRSHQTNRYYIGSTNQLTLSQRLGKHRSNYKEYLKDNTNYTSSYEILQHTDHYIELLELYPCNTKAELYRREGELIRQFKSDLVNICIAGRTSKEHYNDNKEYYKQYIINSAIRIAEYKVNNKEQMAEYNKQYRVNNIEYLLEYHNQYKLNNKEKIAEQKKQPYICECGSTITNNVKQRHMKSTKHINLIQQLFNNELNHYTF